MLDYKFNDFENDISRSSRCETDRSEVSEGISSKIDSIAKKYILISNHEQILNRELDLVKDQEYEKYQDLLQANEEKVLNLINENETKLELQQAVDELKDLNEKLILETEG